MAYSDVPKGQNADFYLSGRARALFRLEYPLATDPPVGTPAWWSNEGVKDAWQGLKSRIGVEGSLTGADGNPLPLKLGVPDPKTGVVPKGPYDNAMPTTTGGGQTPPYGGSVVVNYGPGKVRIATPVVRNAPPVIRQAPPYVDRGGGGGVYSPPPGAVLSTKEIFGIFRGRVVPVFQILERNGMRNHVERGGRVVIGVSPREGFGLGGTPGAWERASPGVSPGAFGLDPYVGVVAFDGFRVRPVDAYTLGQLLGPGWRALLQAAA